MTHPHIDNAPGLKWRKLKLGWQAWWLARSDLVKKRYPFKGARLWTASKNEPEPNELSKQFIAERCQELQDEMLVWARGGVPLETGYDGTWASLVRAYHNDQDSPYHKKRYATRQHYDTLCRRIDKDCGTERVENTDARRLLRLYEGWSANGKKISMGHSMIGMMRTITTFGSTILKCPACRAIRPDLSDMRVEAGKPREDYLTAEQAIAIRRTAHAKKNPYRHSIALAQALQFDGTMRQKDIIGEWVPMTEPGPLSDVFSGNEKWVRGIRGEEIDDDFVLRHVTSKRGKTLVLDLKLCPMVMEEFRMMAGLSATDKLERDHVPRKGPIVINEQTGAPYQAQTFRLAWRKVARAAGVPDTVRNMDSRAGAITEAFEAGAPMEAVRKSATHSTTSMTQRYSRGDAEAISSVLEHRARHRNKEGK